MQGARGAGDGLERDGKLGDTSEKHAEEGVRRKEPSRMWRQGQRRRCIMETEARAEGWVRGVQDCGDVQVQEYFLWHFSARNYLVVILGSSFRRMRR